MRKRTRKNYYKNSRARRREHIIRRCVLGVTVVLLVAGMGGISLLFILAHDALTQSACFEARTISVEGNRRLSREAILKRAGLKAGDNILSVNLGTVRYRLLANPWVATAEVERELPDTIHIRLKERVPIAVLDLSGPVRLSRRPACQARPVFACGAAAGGGGRGVNVAGRRYYLDVEGEIFKTVDGSDATVLPVVTGLRFSDIDPSDPWQPVLFRSVMEVLHLSRSHGSLLPLHLIDCVHADPEMGLTILAFEGGLAIKLGLGDYTAKYDRLRDMLSCLRHEDDFRNIECIDLNDLDRVVVKPSGRDSLLGVRYRKET